MTDLVCGEIHSVPTGAADWHTKEGWQKLGNQYCTCVVKNRHLNTYQKYGIAVI